MYEQNSANTQRRKSISSLNSQRVSVIKWIGKEFNVKRSSTSDLSITEDKSSLPSSDSTVEKSSNEERKYPCSLCKKSFKWPSHLKSHERIHTGERPFQCEICGKTFTRSDGLQCHKVNHITQNGSLFHKDQRHAKEGPLLKAKYPEWSRNNDELARQNMSTEQTRLFYCSVCNRVFLSSVGLTKHFRVHKGTSNHNCEVCKKMFTKRSALEIHSRVHTGIKPYRCNICTKTFSIHGNLKRHLLIHSGDRPYKCLQCSKCFNSPNHLKRHLQTRHKRNKVDSCSTN
ncbi:chromosome alignment-maintaining phospho 1-like [Paramuricea clavata]|uniref:Chromosome alignment-maintaining phospho 1-like n=1 Tax=Paramuricea clavata TaxID=317549 RepID=A0A6S7HE26_PARCT|nr:chromosome alignment-maintaining phospho 1-like [Paramuricea clavata]